MQPRKIVNYLKQEKRAEISSTNAADDYLHHHFFGKRACGFWRFHAVSFPLTRKVSHKVEKCAIR
jgi:hypothetical protein